ncbi:hypothetical protein [Pricia sp.]|uniref:hypothetical protein n=1 Tax=Pricia sp. TaxID=2268138 RepID=UPI003593769C
MKNRHLVAVLIAILFASCGGGDDGGGDDGGGSTPGPDPDSAPAPLAAVLIFPDNNLECNEGSILSESQSNVTFEWNAAQNTDSYEVTVVNLNTNTNQTSNSATTSKTITLERGSPYEWFVVSKANGTDKTATSPKWKFYNQGPGIENYAPFPADAVNPKRGETLQATTKITLEWLGNDVDNDIESFEVFFGTEKDPTVSLGATAESTMEATVVSNQIYYWKVICTDSQGNTSQSEIFEFRVL